MPTEVEGEGDPPPKRPKRTSKEPIRFRRDIGSLGEDAAEDKPSSVQQPRLAKKKKATQKRKRDGSDSSEESEEDSLPLSKKSKGMLSDQLLVQSYSDDTRKLLW